MCLRHAKPNMSARPACCSDVRCGILRIALNPLLLFGVERRMGECTLIRSHTKTVEDTRLNLLVSRKEYRQRCLHDRSRVIGAYLVLCRREALWIRGIPRPCRNSEVEARGFESCGVRPYIQNARLGPTTRFTARMGRGFGPRPSGLGYLPYTRRNMSVKPRLLPSKAPSVSPKTKA